MTFLRCATLLALLTLPAAAAANPARDELLRWVPDDVGFCLAVQDLRGHLAELKASPFLQKWGPALLGPESSAERKQLAGFAHYLDRFLGVSAADLRDDVLGDAFAFAYKPGPAGRAADEEGMFLVRARDARKLATVVDRLNKLQRATGELKGLAEREYAGLRYTARREAKKTTYYLLRGPLLVFTGQEAMLKRAVDAERSLGEGDRAPLTRRLEGLRLGGAFASLTVNPRAWDAAVGRSDDAASRALAAHWKAVDGVGLGLHLGRDARLELAVRGRADGLPPATRRLLAAAAKPSPLWASFPEGALLAASGRLDAASLYEAAAEFAPPGRRKEWEENWQRGLGAMLGKDVVRELLPAVGPEWGLCVTAPPAGGKQWAPNVLLAVRVDPGEGGDVDQAVLSGVQSWLQMVVLGHNKAHLDRPMALKATARGGLRVRYLSGEKVFPPGVEPAFALAGGYLVLASSPAELARFQPPRPAAAAADFRLARVSLEDARAYLKERAEPLTAFVARTNNLTAGQAKARLEALYSGLRAVDRVELRQRAEGGVLTLTLRVTPGLPLKK